MSTTRRKGTVQDQLVAEIFASGGTWKLEGFAEGLVSISFFVGFGEIDHKESADNKYQTRMNEGYG
jgi:hypothetical protein